MRIVRSLADELRRGGLGDLRGGAVQVSTGDEIGVLLETESVGPPRGAAGSPRCVETVSPLSLSFSSFAFSPFSSFAQKKIEVEKDWNFFQTGENR